MRTIIVTSTEIITRETVFKVPSMFDETNDDHRDAVDGRAMDLECGETGVERTITIETATRPCRIDDTLDGADLGADEPERDDQSSWTFYGHWESDELVIEYTREGSHNDDRVDHGYWEQGLWCDSAAAATKDEAMQMLRDEYEGSSDCGPTSRPV